jgi:hypothetical protein
MLEKLSSFEPRKASNFDNISLNNLYDASVKEEINLNVEYIQYKRYFEIINFEMKNQINKS